MQPPAPHRQSSFLSIVMPAYNEAGIISTVLADLDEHVCRYFERVECIVVNDRSTDNTLAILQEAQTRYPYLKVITNERNSGHGTSLLNGLRQAQGDFIFHNDSDNQFYAQDFWLLFERLRQDQADLVIGRRLGRNDGKHRDLISMAARIAITLFFGIRIRDSNSPFRIYRRSAFDKVLPIINKLKPFFTQILMAITARKLEMNVQEVGVRHKMRLTGKVSIHGLKIIKLCARGIRELFALKHTLAATDHLSSTITESPLSYWQTIKRSRSLKYFGLLLAAFLGIGILMHLAGYTFQAVDQLYCRNYLPWAATDHGLDCSQYRSGDDLFEYDFAGRELHYLADNPYQHSYSERIMNGYPIRDAYAINPYSFSYLLNHWLPSPSSSNFSALFNVFLALILGYGIARSLGFTPRLAIIFGILAITLAQLSLYESWNWAMIGYGFVALGMLRFYQKSERLTLIVLALIGWFFILSSSVYQFYIYAGLNLLLIGLLYFDCAHKAKFLRAWGTVIALALAMTLFLNASILNHIHFLNTSHKVANAIKIDWSLFKRKGYAFDPIGWIGREPVKAHHRIVALLFGDHIGYQVWGAASTGYYSPGLVFVILCFVGLRALYKKGYRGYVLLILFWLLYMAGIIQLALSVLIGEPFRSETSIRAHNIFFVLSIFPVIYALRRLLNGALMLWSKTGKIIILAILYVAAALLALIIIRSSRYDQTFLESSYLVASGLIFIVGWWLISTHVRLDRALVVFGLLLPTFARLFLSVPAGALTLERSDLYFPSTSFGKALEQHRNEIQRIALITTATGAKIHPNTAVWFDLATINGYRNPLMKSYNDLFNYQRLIFEGASDPSREFTEFKQSIDYLTNDIPPLQTSQTTVTLPEATKRYFLLTQVNAIIAPADLVINDLAWHRSFQDDKLALWQSNAQTPEFFLTDHTIMIQDPIDELHFMLLDPQWDPQKTTVVTEPTLNDQTPDGSDHQAQQPKPSLELIRKTDGYRLIEAHNLTRPSILTLPVTFNPHWQAFWLTGDTRRVLKVIQANYTFLGVVLPTGSGTIEIMYNDRPSTLNYWLFAAGVGILILTLAI